MTYKIQAICDKCHETITDKEKVVSQSGDVYHLGCFELPEISKTSYAYTLKDLIEIKLLWLTHTLTKSEKQDLENCVKQFITGQRQALLEELESKITAQENMVWVIRGDQKSHEQVVHINIIKAIIQQMGERKPPSPKLSELAYLVRENVAEAWRWGWNDHYYNARGVRKKRKEALYREQIDQWTENIMTEIQNYLKSEERKTLEIGGIKTTKDVHGDSGADMGGLEASENAQTVGGNQVANSSEYAYKVGITPLKVTKEDKKRGKVIAKFHKQAATGNAMLEDKMFYMIVNERPKAMSEAEWHKLLKTVLRVEIVQKYPKLIPIGEDRYL